MTVIGSRSVVWSVGPLRFHPRGLSLTFYNKGDYWRMVARFMGDYEAQEFATLGEVHRYLDSVRAYGWPWDESIN